MGLRVEKTHKSLGSICFYHRKKGGTTTTNNQQPTTNKTANQQPTANHQQPTTNNHVFWTIFKYLVIYIQLPQLAPPPHLTRPLQQLLRNSLVIPGEKFPGTVCCWVTKWAKVCCFQTALHHSSVIDGIYFLIWIASEKKWIKNWEGGLLGLWQICSVDHFFKDDVRNCHMLTLYGSQPHLWQVNWLGSQT